MVHSCIKGRDSRQDEYLDTDKFERLGARSFRLDDRKKCWHLREVWDEEMRKRGTEDFADLMIKARDLAHKSAPEYRAAIIDESQDMTLVQMQFVRALVGWCSENDLSRDAILILDNSAQRIYPRGFRPKWAGLYFKVTGEILKQNFCNNKRIFDAARSIRGEIIIGKEDNDDGACDEVSDSPASTVPARIPGNTELAQTGVCTALLDGLISGSGQHGQTRQLSGFTSHDRW